MTAVVSPSAACRLRAVHTTKALISVHWLRVQECILFKIGVKTYRALNGSAPVYLSSSYFTRVTDVPSRRKLRSTSSNQLGNLLYRRSISTVGKRAFPVFGANFWNSLPPHVTSAPSLAIFRQRLKTFRIHLSYPDLKSPDLLPPSLRTLQ